MREQWTEICHRHIGALFGYANSTDICTIVDVVEDEGVLDFVYFNPFYQNTFKVACRFFFDGSDIVWFRHPPISESLKRQFGLRYTERTEM